MPWLWLVKFWNANPNPFEARSSKDRPWGKSTPGGTTPRTLTAVDCSDYMKNYQTSNPFTYFVWHTIRHSPCGILFAYVLTFCVAIILAFQLAIFLWTENGNVFFPQAGRLCTFNQAALGKFVRIILRTLVLIFYVSACASWLVDSEILLLPCCLCLAILSDQQTCKKRILSTSVSNNLTSLTWHKTRTFEKLMASSGSARPNVCIHLRKGPYKAPRRCSHFTSKPIPTPQASLKRHDLTMLAFQDVARHSASSERAERSRTDLASSEFPSCFFCGFIFGAPSSSELRLDRPRRLWTESTKMIHEQCLAFLRLQSLSSSILSNASTTMQFDTKVQKSSDFNLNNPD